MRRNGDDGRRHRRCSSMFRAGLCSIVSVLVAGCVSERAGLAHKEDVLLVSTPERVAMGETSYETRCKGCHEPATPGAPDRAMLGSMSSDAIYRALIDGKMTLMTIGMPDDEARAIAVYLSAK